MELIVWIILCIIIIVSYNISKKNFISKNRMIFLILSISFILYGLRILIYFEVLNFNPEYIFEQLGLSDSISLEFYRDFEYYYVNWVNKFNFDSVFLLYSGYFVNYQYPPLFIMILNDFKSFIYIPLFFSYLLSIIMFKKICNELYINSNRLVILFALNPIMIFYSAFNWFNVSLLLLFVLISFYYLIKYNPNFKLSIFWLSISILIKQYIIIFLPFYLVYIYFDSNNYFQLKKFLLINLKYGILCFSIILLVYLPFLLLDFQNTINESIIGGISFTIEEMKNNSKTSMVTFISMCYSFNIDNIFVDMLGFLIKNWILFIIFYLICYFYWVKHDFNQDIYFILMFILIINHLFYPRGSFKYYLVILIPFFLISSYYLIEKDIEKGKIFIYLLLIVICSRQLYFILLIIYWIFLIKRFIEFNEEINNNDCYIVGNY